MKKPDEIPAIRIEEHLKIVITEKTANIEIDNTRVAINRRV